MSCSYRFRPIIAALALALLLTAVLGFNLPQPVLGDAEARVTAIVELQRPPLAFGIQERFWRGPQRKVVRPKPDLESPEAQGYVSLIDVDQRQFLQDLSQVVPQATLRRQFRITFNGLAISVPISKLVSLRRLPGVKHVSVSRSFQPLLDTSVPLVNAPAVWNELGGVSQAGLAQKIAILDTGIDQTHPFLTDESLVPPAGFPKGDLGYATKKVIVAKVYTAAGQTGTLDVENGHGTHVAGIAAGVSDFSAQGRIISGVAPKAFLMNYKVLLGTAGIGETPEIIQAIEDAVADGANVVNMSFGGAPDPVDEDPLVIAIRNGTQLGVVFVAAAGNNGSGARTILSPGTAPEAITAGASDKKDSLAFFSSRGPNLNSSIKPDVTAPGVSVFSSWPGGTFRNLSGTSMAAPHVAGGVALLRQLHPAWTPPQIKSALIGTAKTPIYDPLPTEATVMERGGGRIDLQRATNNGLALNPPSYGFGLANLAPAVQSASKSFSATDVTGIGGTWTVSVTETISTPDLRVYTSADSITVSPNESVSFSLVLSSTLPIPAGDYEGFIALRQGSTELRVPYAARVYYYPYITRFALTVKNGELQ